MNEDTHTKTTRLRGSREPSAAQPSEDDPLDLPAHGVDLT
jgi:hypothetical protein